MRPRHDRRANGRLNSGPVLPSLTAGKAAQIGRLDAPGRTILAFGLALPRPIGRGQFLNDLPKSARSVSC
jgi:hypothetical protein